MKWEAVFEAYGQTWTEQGTEPDPYAHLYISSPTPNLEGPPASVSIGASRATDFGKVRCTATVSIICPQQEQTIDMAGEVAFQKALEFCNAGFERLLALPVPPS